MFEIKKSTVNEIKEELPNEQINQKVICNLCGKKFFSKCNLSRHMRTLHLQPNKKECESCNKLFTDAQTLKIHIATIHDKKEISICEVCDNTFTSKKILKIHVNTIHGNRKPNESKEKLNELNEKILMDEINNSAIKEVVEKQQKFQIKSKQICNLCGKSLNSKNNLLKHVKSLHMQITKKDCESCNKTFSDNSSSLFKPD